MTNEKFKEAVRESKEAAERTLDGALQRMAKLVGHLRKGFAGLPVYDDLALIGVNVHAYSGEADVWRTVLASIEAGERDGLADDAIVVDLRHLLWTIAVRGADDFCGGRTRNSIQSRHDGKLSACRRVEELIKAFA